MSGASTRLSVLPCGIVDERSLCRASMLITLSCDLGFPAIHQIIDYALPHIGPVYQDSGVSACRLVLFCAVAEPHTHYGFRRYPLGLWGLDFLFISVRCPPSSLYTFRLRGFARDCHFKGLPEFDGFSAKCHHLARQESSKLLILKDNLPGRKTLFRPRLTPRLQLFGASYPFAETASGYLLRIAGKRL